MRLRFMHMGGRVASLVVVLGGMTLRAHSVAAQTRFAWPDTTVDVGTYTSAAECLAATQRIRDGIRDGAWSAVWRDTMPASAAWKLEPLPALVTNAAARCADRFHAGTVSLGDFSLLVQLYLEAGRDADASVLVERRLHEVGATHEAERVAVLDSVFHLYLQAQPVRLDSAAAILERREWAYAPRLTRLEPLVWMSGAALTAGDTALAQREGQRLLLLADSLTPTERRSRSFLAVRTAIRYILFLQESEIVLDSLQRSTAAYVRVMRRIWALDGKSSDTLPIIGDQASPIVGDAWVPSEAARQPRPTPGRAALIVFWDGSMSCFNSERATANLGILSTRSGANGCYGNAAALHRLARRFPSLQITIVTRTGQNVFGYLPPLSASETAQWLERAAASFHLPGALAIVSQSPSLRLPAPDERIVRVSTDSNVVHYRFGDQSATSSLGAFLVDQHGVVVWYVNGGIGFGESRDILSSLWIRMIDVLLHRGSGGAPAAGN